jgi:ABC-type Fe3+-hydroxamate transport system substrate-binding protein
MIRLTDQLEREVTLVKVPQRIVSLCPSITETLYHFGLEDEVVGRTRFCIHPKEKVKQALRVGGTKDVKLDRLFSLNPDLVIAEKEENIKEQIEAIAAQCSVYVADVKGLDSALDMIRGVGVACGKAKEGNQLAKEISATFIRFEPNTNRPRIAYFIWKDPWMLAGKETYIQDLLQRLGYENVGLELEGRYPTVTEDQLRTLEPELVLLSSEPFPFAQKHMSILEGLLPKARVQLVDGEYFSWYGSRMLEAATYLQNMDRDF